jgi:hypothetical protein
MGSSTLSSEKTTCRVRRKIQAKGRSEVKRKESSGTRTKIV